MHPIPGTQPPIIEPWLRGTHTDVPAVLRGVLHALELAREDIDRWTSGLTAAEGNISPSGLPSVGFQLRHIARSLDRLLTYAEGAQLSPQQLAALKTESMESTKNQTLAESLAEARNALEQAATRVLAFSASDLEARRGVGRKQLPTSVGGLLVHVADHTQRHVGQLVTTAKVLSALRG